MLPAWVTQFFTFIARTGMGNASTKDIHDAVDAGDLEKIEKILEAKIELIDALSKEVE